jgi:hypothetical protein
VTEAPQRAVARHPEKKPRGVGAAGLVHAQQVSPRVVREQRLDMEPHQVAMIRHHAAEASPALGARRGLRPRAIRYPLSAIRNREARPRAAREGRAMNCI